MYAEEEPEDVFVCKYAWHIIFFLLIIDIDMGSINKNIMFFNLQENSSLIV